MRAAPLKGDCIICQAPEAIRTAVNRAVWPEGSMRAANYRSAGVRAASQAATATADASGRYDDLDPKTITRHADHIEESWREIMPGERLTENEVPLATDFSSVMEAGAELAMMTMGGLRTLVRQDPVLFAAVRTKEAIAISKLGIQASTAKETSRLKRNQQAIDVAAIFGLSSGHLRHQRTPDGDEEDASELDDLKAEVADERRLLAAG